MIAILEDDPGRADGMRAVLASLNLECVVHDTSAAMNAWLEANLAKVTLISLDHDLGPSRSGPDGSRIEPGIGREVADFLATKPACCPVFVHSSNGPAAEGMIFALQRAGWTAKRVMPHGGYDWIDALWHPEVRAALEK